MPPSSDTFPHSCFDMFSDDLNNLSVCLTLVGMSGLFPKEIRYIGSYVVVCFRYGKKKFFFSIPCNISFSFRYVCLFYAKSLSLLLWACSA